MYNLELALCRTASHSLSLLFLPYFLIATSAQCCLKVSTSLFLNPVRLDEY